MLRAGGWNSVVAEGRLLLTEKDRTYVRGGPLTRTLLDVMAFTRAAKRRPSRRELAWLVSLHRLSADDLQDVRTALRGWRAD